VFGVIVLIFILLAIPVFYLFFLYNWDYAIYKFATPMANIGEFSLLMKKKVSG
jgi:hypothetical protein